MAQPKLVDRVRRVVEVCGDEPPEEWLRRRYVDEQATYRELSSQLGYTRGGERAIRALLEHFDVPIRRGTEAVKLQWVGNVARRRAIGDTFRRVHTVHDESSFLRGKRTVEYKTWTSMRERCTSPNCPAYPDYGGRGITVCDRWDTFEAFVADMGRRPPGAFSIDRIDNDRGYSPDNCRWATPYQQTHNRRCSRGRAR